MDKITLENWKDLFDAFDDVGYEQENKDFVEKAAIIASGDADYLETYPDSMFELEPGKIIALIKHLLELQRKEIAIDILKVVEDREYMTESHDATNYIKGKYLTSKQESEGK